jgi:hypothetical protein
VIEEMKVLTEQGRLFPHREHVHTAIYRHRMSTGTSEGSRPTPRTSSSSRAGLHDDLGVRGWSMLLTLERTVISSAQPPPHTLLTRARAGDPIECFADVALARRRRFASPFLATVPGPTPTPRA